MGNAAARCTGRAGIVLVWSRGKGITGTEPQGREERLGRGTHSGRRGGAVRDFSDYDGVEA